MHALLRRSCLALVIFAATLHSPSKAHAVDFLQKYERGKLFLRRKLYIDAVRELYQAVFKTAKGKKHFGAHYYLAVAYYRVGDITRSMRIMNRAKKFIKNKRQRETFNMQLLQIKTLFGQLRIIPEVDPEEVGKLKLKIEVKTPFSHEQKRRTYRIVSKAWKTKGIVLSNQSFYLPKGEYRLAIAVPQCLVYGITVGSAVQREIVISSQATNLALKKKRSCECPGGQVPQKQDNGTLQCVCPKNTVWSPKQKRCIVPPTTAEKSWGAKNWPWLTAVGVVVVGAAVAVPVVLLTQSKEIKVVMQGKTESEYPKIFQ